MSSGFKLKLQLVLDHSQLLDNLQHLKMVLLYLQVHGFLSLSLLYHASLPHLFVVATEPRGLTVIYLNSTALEVTWEPPLCDYGIRRGYIVSQ